MCLVCTPKGLAPSLRLTSALRAIEINPLNRAPVERMEKIFPGTTPRHPYIAVLTAKRWHTNGVRLSVSFLSEASSALKEKILSHMNAWGKTANVVFNLVDTAGDVRIAFNGGDDGGYWSYLGTDILLIEADKPTMNLEGFSLNTPESEFFRVVRHETGHTLGFPHEHMRQELVALIEKAKAIRYFGDTQGWSEEEVIAQVLTPLEESSIIGSPTADQNSIMCYQIPGALTTTGKPILGGVDIDQVDYDFAAACYPK